MHNYIHFHFSFPFIDQKKADNKIKRKGKEYSIFKKKDQWEVYFCTLTLMLTGGFLHYQRASFPWDSNSGRY